MMNEQERNELEAENDGFTNDYQRAAAASSMRRNGGDRVRALSLVQDGLHVAVEWSPEYCPITDAVLGDRCTILAFGPDRLVVAEQAAKHHHPLGDERIEIWPFARAPREAVLVETDEIPF
jgi:hypothetical protein